MGFVVFYAVFQGITYLLNLTRNIYILGDVLFWPQFMPWAVTLVPPVCAVQLGCITAHKVGVTGRMLGVVLSILSVAGLLFYVINKNWNWSAIVIWGLILITSFLWWDDLPSLLKPKKSKE